MIDEETVEKRIVKNMNEEDKARLKLYGKYVKEELSMDDTYLELMLWTEKNDYDASLLRYL